MSDSERPEIIPINLFQKINRVREKVSYVQKEEKKIDGKYRAVTHDTVTALVRPSLVELGIIIAPSQVSCEMVETGGKTQSGAKIFRTISCFDVWFIDADNPTDRHCVRVWAHGDDTGDKGPGKAFSYSVKYAVMKLLSLESGDDEESRVLGRAQMDVNRLADIYITIDEATDIKALTAAWQTGVAAANEVGDKEAVVDITDRASKRKGVFLQVERVARLASDTIKN